MEFIIQKENISNALNATVKITPNKSIQPVLSNVLIETITNDRIRLISTDLELSMEYKTAATVEKQGKVTLPAKKLSEIISKLPNKPVCFSVNTENNLTSITCGNSKFEVMGISADEFPDIVGEDLIKENEETVDIEIEPLLKAIKQTVFATAMYDTSNVLSGVSCQIKGKKLEMAATDGNRLARVVESITNEDDKNYSVIIPSRTLNEFSRIAASTDDEKVSIIVKNGYIMFKLSDRYLLSRLIEGQYPKYQQLIPASYSKVVKVDREEFISALDRTATMVNERTNIIKFTLNDNKLLLKADAPDLGDSMDLIDAEYTYEELSIAFNYKFVLESLRNMDSEKIKIEMEGALNAALFKPDNEEDFLCLIMPVQIR